ncbi:hypothetical protein [Paraburkholderia kururiensis]|uniref:hypothetical protein n=1 Tax=Paraburkholderia kururiensis TaxID=984307 RepID=UPI000AE40312|nr:hypothetical protein [Paraburkholderia kururiensis]
MGLLPFVRAGRLRRVTVGHLAHRHVDLLAGARGFNGCIERENMGLEGDAFDHLEKAIVTALLKP